MTAPYPSARLRRLPGTGWLRRRPQYEVEVDRDGSGTTRTVIRSPYSALKDISGWDEATLLEHRASQAWDGGTGPWVAAFTGDLEDVQDE